MLWEILTATRDLGRVNEIAAVLVKHGFGDLVRRLGLSRALASAGRRLHLRRVASIGQLEPAERLRRVLEDLGPTFVKLGQLLSTRVDLFPPDWIAEFEQLQDRVAPVPFAEIEARLEQDLGAKLDSIFGEVERDAIGAGSLAQVHRARLPSGEWVILKARRPGVSRKVAADLRLLARVAELAESEIEGAHRYRPVEVFRQLERSLRSELDFAHEGHNAERLARAFASDGRIHVPKIYWQWTTERLLVQEWIDGIPGRDLAGARAAGLDLQRLAKVGAGAVLRMVLRDGFFHADPHAGNVFYLPQDRIALIDFGMVGRLSEARRDQLVDFLFALVDRDSQDVAEILSDWAIDTQVDPRSLVTEIDVFLDEYHGIALEELSIAAMLADFTRMLREHDLALPADLAMFFKVLLTLEGLGRMLDSSFEIVTAMRPFLEQALRERYSPPALFSRGRRSLRRAVDIVTGLPQDLHNLLRSARRGQVQIRVDLARLDRFWREMDQSANRVTLGIVTAALIIGTAIVMTVSGGPTLFGLPMFGFIGFVSSFILGVALLWAIHRSGRRR